VVRIRFLRETTLRSRFVTFLVAREGGGSGGAADEEGGVTGEQGVALKWHLQPPSDAE
jgi:hypothetical protein